MIACRILYNTGIFLNFKQYSIAIMFEIMDFWIRLISPSCYVFVLGGFRKTVALLNGLHMTLLGGLG